MNNLSQRIFATASLLVTAAIIGCGSNSTPSTGGGTTSPTPTGPNGTPATFAYVGLNVNNSYPSVSQILKLTARANGTVSPVTTLNLPINLLSLAVDSTGQVYAGGNPQSGAQILIYAAGSTGNATPTTTINVADGYAPSSMAVDASGTLYTFDNTSTINIYPKGTTAPSRTISGGTTTLGYGSGIAVDSSGNIFVTQVNTSYTNPSILEFSATANGNVAPMKTITISTPNAVALGIAVDSLGQIYAGVDTTVAPYTGTIQVYASSATGAATPTKTITSSSLTTGGQIQVDGAGNIYIPNQYLTSGAVATYSLLQFPYSASGSVSPAATTTSTPWTNGISQIAIQ